MRAENAERGKAARRNAENAGREKRPTESRSAPEAVRVPRRLHSKMALMADRTYSPAVSVRRIRLPSDTAGRPCRRSSSSSGSEMPPSGPIKRRSCAAAGRRPAGRAAFRARPRSRQSPSPPPEALRASAETERAGKRPAARRAPDCSAAARAMRFSRVSRFSIDFASGRETQRSLSGRAPPRRLPVPRPSARQAPACPPSETPDTA